MIWALLFFLSFAHASETTNSSACFQQNFKKIEAQKIWQDEQWLRLLHFREGLFKAHSQVDSPVFFLADGGYSDAKKELLATVKAFCANQTVQTEDPRVKHLQAHCLFPAREQFLESKGLGNWPQPYCRSLSDWRNKIGDEKISLVFASYYANNPSSVFGHTLLRVDRLQESSGQLYSPLLSYGVNFAGNATTSNPVLYALLGMMGGFKGVFSSLPYYYKVREYSDFDSRDLWEYQLHMTPAQRNLLLNHLWEQGFSYFNYYYFTENCSYHLLTSLDVALPERNLDEKIPYWVIPVDTVKAVTNSPGLIESVSFRPSLFRQYKARLKRLEEQGLESRFYRLLNDIDQKETKKNLNGLSPLEQAYVMDTLLDYWDFKYTKELLDKNSPSNLKKMEFLKMRAALPMTPSLKFDVHEMERPDLSHETLRAGLSLGHDQFHGGLIGLDLRFALHDFLDSQQGYPKNAKIEFFRAQGNYYSEKNQFKFTELKFFDVELLTPWKRLENSFSWRSIVGFERSFMDCRFCMNFHVLFQGGGALGFFNDRLVTYLLAGTDLQFSPSYERANFKALPMGTLGAKLNLPKDFNFIAEGNYFVNSIYALPNSLKIKSEFRKAFRLNDAAGAEYSRETFTGFENEAYQFNYYHYF